MSEFERELLRRVGITISSLAVEIPFDSLYETKMMVSNLEYNARELKKLVAKEETRQKAMEEALA